MAATGDGLESKDLQTMISDRNETAPIKWKVAVDRFIPDYYARSTTEMHHRYNPITH